MEIADYQEKALNILRDRLIRETQGEEGPNLDEIKENLFGEEKADDILDLGVHVGRIQFAYELLEVFLEDDESLEKESSRLQAQNDHLRLALTEIMKRPGRKPTWEMAKEALHGTGGRED